MIHNRIPRGRFVPADVRLLRNSRKFSAPLDFHSPVCYTIPTQKNNADRSTLVENRACRATATLGDKETTV